MNENLESTQFQKHKINAEVIDDSFELEFPIPEEDPPIDNWGSEEFSH